MKINAFSLGPPAKSHEFQMKIYAFWLASRQISWTSNENQYFWLGPPAKFNKFLMKINAWWLGPPAKFD